MKYIYVVKLDNGVKTDIFADSSLDFKVNDTCVFRKSFYQDSGVITRICGEYDKSKVSEDIGEGIRKANMHDKSSISENQMRNKSAIRTAQKFIDDLKLEMKLLNSHYTLDGKQLTIQFTADGRVDFRELVKELSKALGTRIELRQIGVRDESAIYGGIFICGQELCCSKFLKSFDSINVKMAKEQDLSLTPSNISGVCGRLKCCLKYEHEGYVEMEKTMPRKGEICTTPEGKGKVTDRNLLTQTVIIQFENGTTKRFKASEIKFNNRNKRNQQTENDENLEELKKLED